ncbi:MAG: hypothetical protein N2170_06240 [Bacteroidia bacterium]|nr:hypothetical protein [Bacteroidia bacterium]
MGSLRYWAKAALCAFVVAEAQSIPLPYQPVYRKQALEALAAFYGMDFSRAERLLAELDSIYGVYVGTAYLRALGYSWRIEIDPSTTWFDSFWERELRRTDSLLRCCASHPLEKYFIGFGQRALEVRRLYVRGELMASVWKARELLSLLERIRKYVDLYPEMHFELGLYEYYIAYFYRNYPIMRPILRFFPPGDEEKGLARLEQCARDPLNYTQTEAAYFLGYIYLYQARRPHLAEKWFRQLSERFPDNPLFRRMWAESLYELGEYKAARQVIQGWLDKYESSCLRPPCYLIWSRYPTGEAVQAYALVGMTRREEGRYAEAKEAFARMDSLLGTLSRFPPPTWARLMREAALLEKRMGRVGEAERRMEAVRARSDVPAYLKHPLSD